MLPNYEEKVLRLEKDVDELKNKVDDLGEMKLILVELKTISKYQAERGDKLDTLIEEQGKTLISVCERMNMNEDNIGELVREVSTLKDDHSLKFGDLAKNFAFTGAGALATYLLTKILS